MVMIQTKPCGSWRSPITSSMIVDQGIKLGQIIVDEEDIYWDEMRSDENGRCVIMRWGNGRCQDVLGAPYSARSSVYEYGGAPFTAYRGNVYFSNGVDQKLYVRSSLGKINPITTTSKKQYAHPIYDPRRGVIYAIEEDLSLEQEPRHSLVKIGDKIERIAEGEDFYSMPALHPKGTHLAFLSWNHPNMPWDGTTLWVGQINPQGTLSEIKRIAGSQNESIFQPMWSKEGVLHYVSDRTGWWNLYKEGGEPLYPMEAEFGQPLWVFGMENYGFLEDGRIAAVYTVQGTDFLGIIDPKKKNLKTLDLPFTSYTSFKVTKNLLYFVAASPKEGPMLACCDIKTQKLQCIRKSQTLPLSLDDISLPESVTFPTGNGEKAYGFLYLPKNKHYKGSDRPPLIVKSHGGPSARATPAFNFDVQFWTSRGFAVFDVNYRGSTGYGREYRERLKGNWGIIDVDDCINGALYLAEIGHIDKKRMVIRGKSSGGYTALAALTFRNVFKAGVSYYGISDLEALAKQSHKFEAYYLESLIGPYPREKKRYQALSPIHHIEKLSCPLLLFQGGKDKVVLPSQSEKMFKALNQKQVPASYILFEEEKHGFRIAKNIERSFDSELYFYGKIFGLTPSDRLIPIPIRHLS